MSYKHIIHKDTRNLTSCPLVLTGSNIIVAADILSVTQPIGAEQNNFAKL